MPLKKVSAQALFEDAINKAKSRIDSGGPRTLSPQPAFNKEEDEATVYLYDVISSWWGVDAAEFVTSLNAITAKTIHLRINSPGGSTVDAEAIQTAIQQHKSKVVAHIDGWAASAATYIALAADEVEISDGGLFMIHNAWSCVCGNADDFLATAELLEKIDANLVKDYQRKTGNGENQIKQWMKDETWFNAEEALENGFVDRIFTMDKADFSEENTEEEGENAKNEANLGDVARLSRERAMALIEVGA